MLRYIYLLVSDFASLCARSRAVCPSIVGAQATAIVVAEFNDNKVSGLDKPDDGIETALAGVASRAATTDSLVIYCNSGKVFGDLVSPSYTIQLG